MSDVRSPVKPWKSSQSFTGSWDECWENECHSCSHYAIYKESICLDCGRKPDYQERYFKVSTMMVQYLAQFLHSGLTATANLQLAGSGLYVCSFSLNLCRICSAASSCSTTTCKLTLLAILNLTKVWLCTWVIFCLSLCWLFDWL